MADPKNRWALGVDRVKTRLGIRTAPARPAGNKVQIDESVRRLERLRQEIANEEAALREVRAKLARARGHMAPSGAPRDDAPIFFVMGRAKSGTSWLMRMLNAHPEILCRGEGRFFGRDDVREIPDRKGMKRVQPRSLYGAIANSEYLRTWIGTSAWTRGDDVEGSLANLTGLATSYFLYRRLYETDKRIVGDKTPFIGTESVKEMATILPHAKLIHIIRDGRDVAISSIHHVWNRTREEGGIHELTPEESAKREAYRSDPRSFVERGESIFLRKRLVGTASTWTEMVGRAREDGPVMLGDNYAEVRYEDLLARTEWEVGRLLRFLGAHAGEEVVRRCVESSNFEKQTKGRRRGQEDPTAFLRKGVVGEWKSVFTDEDKRTFKEIAGDLLVELGYEKDHDW